LSAGYWQGHGGGRRDWCTGIAEGRKRRGEGFATEATEDREKERRKKRKIGR